jgi:serine/threonine-protein kinase
MAELFLARAETELGATRLVVVKLILPAFAEDPRFADMLIHEAKLAAQLSHRHIVQVHDLGRGEGHLFIAMEYVEGFDLNSLLRLCTEKGVGLPLEHALGILADILEGLDYAHRRTADDGDPLGIVHRDVSPSNVLISYDGEVKLCDFGIARANDLVRPEVPPPQVWQLPDPDDALKGKASYMSPEHARGDALDGRSDVFSAGIILWELLAGRRLYRARGAVPLLDQARRAEIPPLPVKDLANASELERIVRRALAFDREDRYPTASAFQRDLEDYLAGAGLLTSRLKLGDWLGETFGTQLIEERRASERRLPSSMPPARPSGFVRARSVPPPAQVVPPAPRVPADLALAASAEPLPEAGVLRTSQAMSEPVRKIEPNPEEPPRVSDAELFSWARKRGLVSLLFFFTIAVVIFATWMLTR